MYTLFIQERARHSLKTVSGHFLARIAKAADCAVERVFVGIEAL